MIGPGTFTLVTPEGVGLDVTVATPYERLIAFGIDLAIIFLATFVLVLAVLPLGLLGGAGDLAFATVLFAIFVVRYGYFIVFEMRWHGGTPGKRLLGLRAISFDGAGLTMEAVFARNLLRDFEIVLPGAALAAPEALVGNIPSWLWFPAVLWILVFSGMPILSRLGQRAGDLIAGTLVVRVPTATLPEDEAARGLAARLSVHFVREQLLIYGEHELETLAEVLRGAESGKATTSDLRVVAHAIAVKIGYRGSEPASDPHRFLRAFYKYQRAHLEKELLFGKRKADKTAQRRK